MTTGNNKNGKNTFETRKITRDVLIIGGGTAGCFAGAWFGRHTNLSVAVAEKADIRRSGCLAAGVNALNAYISKGHTPDDYVDYAAKDAAGIIRYDLEKSMAERFNEVTEKLEKLGLVILKDKNGDYCLRGWRNVKINGENIKPLLAGAVQKQKNVSVYGHVNITDFKIVEDSESDEKRKKRIAGAYGFSVCEKVMYDFSARAVLIATGGAAGLYRPNNPGFSRHKLWYPPFNTGAGYAMGILAGAEMTSFEHRFVALRCKDTIAPTGTIAQGVHARQVNADGEIYETRYGVTTPERIYGTIEETRAGRGPCSLRTKGISRETEKDLYKAYLNMAPSQTLKWLEEGHGPSEENVEIEGTEPYIVGGHTAGGYWVDTKRRTTLSGLYAAGDVSGGAPQKYVTGALAEGEIAAETIAEDLEENERLSISESGTPPDYQHFFNSPSGPFTIDQAEAAMQKIMDEYAGGIRTQYRYNTAGLQKAENLLASLEKEIPLLHAEDTYDLMKIYEVRDRMIVCRVLIAHMRARKETRWHTFGEFIDVPKKVPSGECYVNSRVHDGKIEILYRPIVRESTFVHADALIDENAFSKGRN